jgi:hypothetical protein
MESRGSKNYKKKSTHQRDDTRQERVCRPGHVFAGLVKVMEDDLLSRPGRQSERSVKRPYHTKEKSQCFLGFSAYKPVLKLILTVQRVDKTLFLGFNEMSSRGGERRT